MTRWACSFSFYLPCSSLTLCSIHTDNLVPLYDTTPLPLCPCPCSTYDAVLILSITKSLFINTYVLQSQYGLPHYAYLTRRTSHFLYVYHIRHSPYARFVWTTSFPYLYHPLSVILVPHMIPSLLQIQ